MKKYILLLLVVCLKIHANQDSNTSTWDGTRTKFTSGIGTELDPFIITTASQLAYLSDGGSYENKYFRVDVNIDLANLPWTPIGAFEDTPFKGNIDFNYHTISNLSVESDRACGLFGYIENASLSKLTVKSSTINGLNLVGSIVAKSYNSTLSNLENYASVNSSGGLASVGGIVGDANETQVYNVINWGTITNKDMQGSSIKTRQSWVGGIAGIARNCYITQCANKGELSAYTGVTLARYYAAGIVGFSESSTISYCFNTADITCRLYFSRSGNDGTKAYVSGISNNEKAINSYNTGQVSGCSYWDGRYASISTLYNGTNVTNCFSTWDIVGCKAKSYTSSNPSENGIKVSLDELNTTTIVSELDNGAQVFCKDEYPYINDGCPFFVDFKRYNIKTELPSEINTTSANLKGAIFATGYNIKKRGFKIKSIAAQEFETYYSIGNELLINDLKPFHKYEFYFFAELDNGEVVVGDKMEFMTLNHYCPVKITNCFLKQLKYS